MDYNSGSAMRAFLENRGLSILKKWGQNFLINPRARETLVHALDVHDGDEVWEIGPGMGAMTTLLLERGAAVLAFEIDKGLSGLLEELFKDKKFTLVRGDVLKTWKGARESPFLLGNLPYAIAALLVGNLIEGGRFFERMVITVQKEVALRMAAPPGSKAYSSISVLCASAYSIRKIMSLKGPSFYPPPRVESAALCLTRLKDMPRYGELFFPLVRAMFSFRRKTAANNLEHFLGSWCTIRQGQAVPGTMREAAETALGDCGLRPGERAEHFSPEDFSLLARRLEVDFIRKPGRGT
jgi:16S rRNA (adenine1518-N6/adenine1519-N6)-dimethyltransferase